MGCHPAFICFYPSFIAVPTEAEEMIGIVLL